MLIAGVRFESGTAPLLEPAPSCAQLCNALRATPSGAELDELVARASSELAPGARGVDLMIGLVATLQARYVIRPGSGVLAHHSDTDIMVILPTEHRQVGEAACLMACRIVAESAMTRHDGDTCSPLVAAFDAFKLTARMRSLDQLGVALARVAVSLDIPVYRLDAANHIYQLGTGRHRRLAHETMVEPVSQFARTLSSNKEFTLSLMRDFGVPVLTSGTAMSEDGAVQLAHKIGGAVVVKPVAAGKGRGVSVNLRTEAQVRKAFRGAARIGANVLVEQFAEGADYRILVVGGTMIAAARRIPAHVTGDGVRPVAGLIDALNADPRRGSPYEKLLERVQTGPAMNEFLARQSMSLETVPAAGQIVWLAGPANISQGGTAVDVTAQVHPDNRDAAERAAAAVNLGVAGVDFISPDISRSWREAGGWVLEVNVPPGLRPHWIANPDQDVVTPIVRQAFPVGATARIPTVGITGSIGKSTTCRMATTIAEAAGLKVGLSTTQGVWSGRYQLSKRDAAGGLPARKLLMDQSLDIGVFEFARGGLVKAGMTIDSVDVAAVLNIHDNHLGLDGIRTRADLAEVKAILVRQARKWVFLNADDDLVLAMRALAGKASIGLVSEDPSSPVLRAHAAGGGCIVTLHGEGPKAAVRLTDGGKVRLELPLRDIPATRAGTVRSVAINAMFAAGIGYGLGLQADAIGRGLSGFVSDAAQNPGRHNWIGGLPFALMLHWTDGVPPLQDMMETLRQVSATGTRRLYLTSPGNRPDDWLRAMGRTVAGHFDTYHCADLADLRGRPPGAVPALLAEGLRAAGIADDAIVLSAGDRGPLAGFLHEGAPGDLLVIVTFETYGALAVIDRYRKECAAPGFSAGPVAVTGH